MEFLGSQFGVFLLIVIGFVVVWFIDATRKNKLSNESADEVVGCFFKIGIVFAIICTCIYLCTQPDN